MRRWVAATRDREPAYMAPLLWVRACGGTVMPAAAVRSYLEAVLHGCGGEERDAHDAQESEVQVADVSLESGKGGGRGASTALARWHTWGC